jgi:hypothetical protein
MNDNVENVERDSKFKQCFMILKKSITKALLTARLNKALCW